MAARKNILTISFSYVILYTRSEGHTQKPERNRSMKRYKVVFDTETTSTGKKFCYDIGYIIIDLLTGQIVVEKHFVIEQTWHNLPLFESAYYKDKRANYVSLMRARKAKLTKWGYAMREMARDFEQYEITDAYAYNSKFDDEVFSFNCDWFKCINPFDNVAIHDIWGYASRFITNTEEYKAFCDKYNFFTENNNYCVNAETVYRFITNEPDFIEEHMGLYDSQIEGAILLYCLAHGAEEDKDYPVVNIIPRPVTKPFTIKVNGQIVFTGEYKKKYCRNDTFYFNTVK